MMRYDNTLDMYVLDDDDTQPIPILRDFNCPNCGKGTSRVGRRCLDCADTHNCDCD